MRGVDSRDFGSAANWGGTEAQSIARSAPSGPAAGPHVSAGSGFVGPPRGTLEPRFVLQSRINRSLAGIHTKKGVEFICSS